MHLFDRLPTQLFAPLAGRNCRLVWDLLVRLSERFFGADCIPPYPEGYLHDQLTKEIERFLLERNDEDSDDEEFATPLNVRANQWLARLVDTGWLVEDRIGVRNFVSMRPVVARFLEALEHFADEGPTLIGGSVQLIHNQLKEVLKDPKAQAAGFQSAAQLCARMINGLNATTIRVRDLIRDLTQEEGTPSFVKRFFAEHIEALYVRDFRQLRTENHPLMLRFQIISIVEQITTEEPARSQLLAGYRDLPGAGQDAEPALERDVARFGRLLDVERFLERMDRVVDAATRQGLAYLGYRLKATERLETILTDVARSALALDNLGQVLEGRLLSPAPLLADYRLRLPAQKAAPPVRRAMVRREMTLREQAERLLRREMVTNRDTTPSAIARYVHQWLQPGEDKAAIDLPVRGVADAVALMVLLRMAALREAAPKHMRTDPLLRTLDFEVARNSGARIDTDHFELTDFRIHRRADRAT